MVTQLPVKEQICGFESRLTSQNHHILFNGGTNKMPPIIECTYFDVKASCSICGERPAMRKTGKCAPHSLIPYDMSRENDWLDCYAGCVKHDPKARKTYMEQQRNEKGPTRIQIRQVSAVPSKLPNLAKLSLLFKHKNATADLAKIILEATSSRGVTFAQLARLTGTKSSTMEDRMRGEIKFPFIDVCQILDYLYELDNKHNTANNRKPQ